MSLGVRPGLVSATRYCKTVARMRPLWRMASISAGVLVRFIIGGTRGRFGWRRAQPRWVGRRYIINGRTDGAELLQDRLHLLFVFVEASIDGRIGVVLTPARQQALFDHFFGSSQMDNGC